MLLGQLFEQFAGFRKVWRRVALAGQVAKQVARSSRAWAKCEQYCVTAGLSLRVCPDFGGFAAGGQRLVEPA